MNKKLLGLCIILFMLIGTATPVRAASLTSAQISAIVALLQSFGADQATINNVQVSLNGGTPTGGGTQAWCHTFNTDLKINDESIEVRLLSVALSKEGFHRDSNNDWTGFSEEVASAVVQFQAKYDIRQTGYVGPITRAKLNALYGCHSGQQPTQTSITFPPNGWYVHNFDTSIMLTKQKALPNCLGTERACYGEQIDVAVSTTTLAPEQYVANIIQDGVYPSTQKWGTLNGHKSFSMTYVTDADTTSTDGQYIFVGSKVYQILLYPSAEKNRPDFQQVVNYYATKSQ